jgi:hypothetical protein
MNESIKINYLTNGLITLSYENQERESLVMKFSLPRRDDLPSGKFHLTVYEEKQLSEVFERALAFAKENIHKLNERVSGDE